MIIFGKEYVYDNNDYIIKLSYKEFWVIIDILGEYNNPYWVEDNFGSELDSFDCLEDAFNFIDNS